MLLKIEFTIEGVQITDTQNNKYTIEGSNKTVNIVKATVPTPETTQTVTPTMTPAVTPTTTPKITPAVTPTATPKITPVLTPKTTPIYENNETKNNDKILPETGKDGINPLIIVKYEGKRLYIPRQDAFISNIDLDNNRIDITDKYKELI